MGDVEKLKKSNKLSFLVRYLFVIILSIFVVPCVVNGQKSDAEILSQEPIDVVIKYIDLTDPNLKREGIPQVKKDEDNCELRYACRSILKNIPWIRKIHILMPNEKVRYFKEPNEIKDKIVYIKDKDFLGFDSANSITFEFNLHNLRRFGVSENFIYFNDDCFVGKTLKKSDFFYVKNKRVVPYIIHNSKVGYNRLAGIRALRNKMSKGIENKFSHSGDMFLYHKLTTYSFLGDVLRNRRILLPIDLVYSHHNALGENLSDLKEIHDIVAKRYKYANIMLKEKKRSYYHMQHQSFYSFYALNKWYRKRNSVSGSYVDLKAVGYANFNIPLFCINTGALSYTNQEFAFARVIMNKLFPKRSSYEKQDVPNGTYVIESALSKNKVLSVAGRNQDDGANIEINDKNSSDSQKFEVSCNSDGEYTITPKCSGKKLDVAFASSSMGANIWQYKENNTNAQKWYFISADKINGEEYFYLVSKCNNLCADIENGDPKNGSNIRCWEPNGTNAQKFRFVKVG